MADVTDAYAHRAIEYEDLLGCMDAVHVEDRRLIDAWARSIDGRVLDAGCGPGHWTDHLVGQGLDARGIDLVPTFVERARARYPRVRFDVESIEDIDEPDGALGGILSWFSTIHHEPSRLGVPPAEFARTLRPGGMLVLGYFVGASLEPFDHAVVRAFRWPTDDMVDVLGEAGFDIVEARRRPGDGDRILGALVCRRRPRSLNGATTPAARSEVATGPESD